MQQQQQQQMFGVQPSVTHTNVTTEQIQKCLDENKRLILAILENQNLGKLAECAQFQAQLQRNLMYLAAIADAQPQTPATPSQMSQQPTMPQVPQMQHPQSAVLQQQQQSGASGPRLPFQINTLQPHDQQHQQLAHLPQQQSMPGFMGMRMGAGNGIYPAMQPGHGPMSNLMDARGRQDGTETGSVDVQRRSSGQGSGGNRE